MLILFLISMVVSIALVVTGFIHKPLREGVRENFMGATYFIFAWVFVVAVLIVNLRPDSAPEPEYFDLYSIFSVIWVLVTIIPFMLFIRK
jgi:hypothetical protein